MVQTISGAQLMVHSAGFIWSPDKDTLRQWLEYFAVEPVRFAMGGEGGGGTHIISRPID